MHPPESWLLVPLVDAEELDTSEHFLPVPMKGRDVVTFDEYNCAAASIYNTLISS
jgi:hypothetical protein